MSSLIDTAWSLTQPGAKKVDALNSRHDRVQEMSKMMLSADPRRHHEQGASTAGASSTSELMSAEKREGMDVRERDDDNAGGCRCC